jgi:hypothetical protein
MQASARDAVEDRVRGVGFVVREEQYQILLVK